MPASVIGGLGAPERLAILFKTRTGGEKDDNNGISNVSAYTPSSERNSKRIRADLRAKVNVVY